MAETKKIPAEQFVGYLFRVSRLRSSGREAAARRRGAARTALTNLLESNREIGRRTDIVDRPQRPRADPARCRRERQNDDRLIEGQVPQRSHAGSSLDQERMTATA